MDDLDSLLISPLVFIDFTELGIVTEGEVGERLAEVSMEPQQEHHYTLWEEEYVRDMHPGEPSLIDTKDMVSTASVKEDITQEFPDVDYMIDDISDKDIIKLDLLCNTNTTKEDYRRAFSSVGHIPLLVENNKNDTEFITVENIIKNIACHMVMVNGGLSHKWTYRNRECYALLDYTGCWDLYAIAPMKYVDDARPKSCNDPSIKFLKWDENNYMYTIMLDLKTNVTLQGFVADEALPGSTFKDLSYCKAYVNAFVDGIRRGN